MLIQHINLPRRVEDGDAVNFTIDAVQCDIVSTATTELPPGVGVKKSGNGTSGTSKAGTSNSSDPATANRATPTKDNGKIPVQFSNRHPMVYLGLAESWAII